MKNGIDYQLIRDSYGCDNCEHLDDGHWDEYCEYCSPDCIIPSEYRPTRGTIQEKLFYGKLERITYSDFLHFLKYET